MDARRAFLSELIDDAGLFPPASLPIEDAVRGHVEAREGPHGWMMGRFICPASLLPDLAKVMPGTPERWRLSVLLDGDGPEPWLERVTADLLATRGFAEEAGERAVVELVETRMPPETSTTELRRFVEAVEEVRLPSAVTPFLEVAPGAVEAGVAAVAEVRAGTGQGGACAPPGAKLRCGGGTADLFPTPRLVATFIDACRLADVPFKATAGLHHPFRHRDPATGFVRHGFVNLVGAAVLARAHGLTVASMETVIAEEDPSAFILDAVRFAWRDREVLAGPIADARRLFTSYGSCSFEEPVEDLLALGVLPA